MIENKDAIDLLLNKEECADKLNDWEVDYLDSIQHKADRLSPNQQAKLKETVFDVAKGHVPHYCEN